MARDIKTDELIKREEIKAQKKALTDLFENYGSKNMNENELLSLLLSFSLKNKDCFEAASSLLTRFGSFSNIFDAPLDALLEFPFMNLNTALLIKSVPELCRREMLEAIPKNIKIKTAGDAEKYLYPYFLGYNMEMAFALLLDKNGSPLKTVKLGTGLTQSVDFSSDILLREALTANASAFVLAHSHPGGKAVPSKEDEAATVRISSDLSICNITCLDHLIFSKTDCFYMSQSGKFDASVLAFSRKK